MNTTVDDMDLSAKKKGKDSAMIESDASETKVLTDKDQKKYKKKLEEMMQCVKESQDANRENIKRFNDMQTFVFKTQISEAQDDALTLLKRPKVQFNMCNALIDRLCGEYSKQEPSINVSSNDGVNVDEKVLAVVEGHLRHLIFEASKNNTQYYGYREQLVGGWSIYKVYTDYKNEMAFEQDIFLEKAYDSTLVGFDTSSRVATKADSSYSYQLFPMTVGSFKSKYKDIDISDVKFNDGEGFNFAYTTDDDKKVIIVCDYYEKTDEERDIVRLSNGKSMFPDEYKDFVTNWNTIEQPPVIVQRRKTIITKVCRHRFAADKMIEIEKDCCSKYIPLVFVDGNSAQITSGNSSGQFTKPYLHHAQGIQNLINIAGQTIAADIENMTMQKLVIAEESLPSQEAYRKSLRKFQQAEIVVWKSKGENGQPNPPPEPMQRVGLPAEVLQLFTSGQQIMQSVVGSYDAQLGVNNRDLSGVALVEGATQSNATAMPYVVNNMLALNQVAQIVVDMMPRVMVTPRTIPVRLKDGSKEFVEINTDGGIQLDFSSSDLNVKVEAGVNFEIEKNRSLEQMLAMMKENPEFNEFMNQQGMDVILDNMSFRGVDVLKERFKKWMEQKQQQPPQPNPDLINAKANQQKATAAQQASQAKMLEAQNEQIKIQHEAKDNAFNTAIEAKKVDNQTKDSDTRRIVALTGIGESKSNLYLQAQKIDAEEGRTRAELGMAAADSMRKDQDQEHTHLKDILEMQHGMSMDKANLANQQESDADDDGGESQ